nr:hypothetical protein Q903MT_gene4928 [Picea sitchensis]
MLLPGMELFVLLQQTLRRSRGRYVSPVGSHTR